jgi:hypothetical protein
MPGTEILSLLAAPHPNESEASAQAHSRAGPPTEALAVNSMSNVLCTSSIRFW